MLTRLLRTGLCVLVAMMCTAVHAATPSSFDATLAENGLEKVKVKGIDRAYVRPGTDLSAYTKIQLDPVEVSFDPNWNPDKTGSRSKLSEQERNDISSGVARVVSDEFVKTLQAKSSYQVVDAAGPGVLHVKARIVNLYVNAPDVMTPGRSRTYTVSSGSMTLVAELSDSQSHEVLARVADRREGRNTGTLTLTNSIVNESEARAAASSWARILRDRMDRAHGIGRK